MACLMTLTSLAGFWPGRRPGCRPKADVPMSRILPVVVLSALGVAILAVPPLAQTRTLNVHNWSDYVEPTVIEAFTKETAIKVRYDTFDANETLETKLLAAKSGYDVVVPTAYFLQRQIQAGVFQKLNKSRLPHLANALPGVKEQLGV